MALKRAVLNLYVYNGSFGVDKPTTPNYIINKEVLENDFASQIDESFKLIKPYFDLMSNILTTNLNGESLLN